MTTTSATTSATSRPRGVAARTPRRLGIWRLVSDWLDRPMTSFHLLLGVFSLMLVFGLMMVLSASAANSFRSSDSAFSVFTSQVMYAAIGLVGFVVILRMPIRAIRSLSTTAVIASLALLVAVLIPGIGQSWNGARSWIAIGAGFQFQPSEVAKLALLLWAAHVLASSRAPRRRLKDLLLPVVPVFAVMVVLVMAQPDLGTTVTLVIVFLAVMYFAGAPLWAFGGLATLGVGAMIYLATSAGYRFERIAAWLDPSKAPARDTYQMFQGLYAMGSGGIFGVGLGQSKMKWGRLPAADSDFIFAIVGEELGLIGTLTVIFLFGALAYTGLRIARRNVDPFVKIVAGAATAWLVGQAAINVGYVTGLLPVTGLPLPMFSAGGTSLVVTMAVFGLLANFARREPQAAAALATGSSGGLAAFLGVRRSRVGAPPSRAAVKRREKVRAQRAAARRQRAVSDAADDVSLRPRPNRNGGAVRPARGSTGRRPGHPAGAPRQAAARQRKSRRQIRGQEIPARRAAFSPARVKRYPVRRALGFPVPHTAEAARGGRAGRTVRP